ncbi:MAG: TonB-dependent receptor [Alphaproteobacteria bacterium PA2]|nr:MAG: TonB-dependent receptor [Alphaproteobacteria bacterium PA2]
MGRIHLNIPPKTYSEALIDLAVQANISMLGVSTCKGNSRGGLKGSFTLNEALDRLLDDANCTWRFAGRDAVQISARPSPQRSVEPPAQVGAPPTLIEEVLVTATKRVQRADRLATAISVVPGDQLRATGTTDPLETTGQLAGVQTTNLGPGRDKLLLRGLSDGAFTGRSRSTVGTYLDDTPINYNAPDPDLRLIDVARVEVIRGPQGALYGSGSLSGLYRIVTESPKLDVLAGRVGASTGWTQGGAPSTAIEGVLNAPLIEGAAAIRLAGYREVQGGYLDNTRLGRSDVDRTTRDGGRLSVSYRPNSVWSFGLTSTVQHLKTDDTQYTTPTQAPGRTSGVAEAHDNDISLVNGSVRGNFGWGELTSTTGYVRHAYSSIYDATPVAGIYTLNNSSLGVYYELTRTQMLVQDLVLASPGQKRFGWVVGLYAADMRESSPSHLDAGPTLGRLNVVYREDRSDKIQEFAGYGEATYALTPNWTVAAGARIFSTAVHTNSEVTSERFEPRSLERNARYSGVSPKFSLQYEPTSDILVYGVISEGYRAGGINSGGARPLPSSRETFAPDRLKNYEVGLKLKSLDRHMELRSALFHDIWTNIQTDQFRPSGIPYTTNVGDAATTGLEVEWSYAWDFGLSLEANGLYARSRTSNANPDYAPRLTQSLPGVPQDALSLIASYRRPVLKNATLNLVGEVSYIGKSRVTFDPANSPTMGGYSRAKLIAELRTPRWDGQIFITNPTNEAGDTFAFGNPFSFSQGQQATPMRPRTIGVSLSANF